MDRIHENKECSEYFSINKELSSENTGDQNATQEEDIYDNVIISHHSLAPNPTERRGKSRSFICVYVWSEVGLDIGVMGASHMFDD